jgi:hypothetical protein
MSNNTKVQVLSFIYNEEYLLPFFLKHYDWVDQINVIYDKDSNDDTLNILESNPKVKVIPFKFPDMMDDILKVKKVNEEYKKIRHCNRILLVDADEFIFVDKAKVEAIKHPIINVKLYNVYRHTSESDLDVNKPIKDQRRHGYFEKMYNKPIIVNTCLDILWGPGNHTITRTPRSLSNLHKKTKNIITGQRCATAVDCNIIGAHWANADPCFCVDRRVKGRRDRQSKYNLEHHLTVHCHNITEESVLAECIIHENELMIF